MNNLAIFDMKDRDGKPCVTSKQVAEAFGKKHKHVMRDIRIITAKCSESFTERNFALSKYTDTKGEKRPMYLLTKDGFTMLAMGYTTPEAMKIKVAYITRFNEMEERLRRTTTSEYLLSDFTNPAIAARAWAEQYEQCQSPVPQQDGADLSRE